MTRQEQENLGLDRIYGLIQAPSSFLASVKQQKLSASGYTLASARSAYERRDILLRCLKAEPRHKWQELFAHLCPLRLSGGKASLSITDLYELKSFFYHYRRLRDYALERNLKSYTLPDLQLLFELLDPEASGLPGFRLSPLFSSKLSTLDNERQGQNLLLKKERVRYLEEAKSALGNQRLKESFCLSRSESELVRSLESSAYFMISAQSVANITFSLADSQQSNAIKEKIARLNLKIEEAEEEILENLSARIYDHKQELDLAIENCAELGWDYMLADYALQQQCCIPVLNNANSTKLYIKAMRNLPLQKAIGATSRDYQDLDISFEGKVNLITGPNMGGKTSLLKALAQCAELCRRAIPIPAKEAAMPLYQYIYYNNERENDSLSSFGAEVVAFNKALGKAGRGLYLLDEFARGTNPYEGEALATAVISYMAQTPHSTIAATHYTKPAGIKGISHFRIKGIDPSIAGNPLVKGNLEERLRFLAQAMDYTLVEVTDTGNPPLDAIRIASILGMPEAILKLVEQTKHAKD